MTVLLVVLSVIFTLVGLVNLSQATLGVGVMCLAIALGIWARINQAGEHHRKALAELERIGRPPSLPNT